MLVSKYSPNVRYKRASLQPCAISKPCIIGQHISYLWAPSFLSQLQPHMACCCLFYILETSMSGLAWSFFPIWMKFPLDAYLVHFPPWSTCTYLTLQWCFNNHSAMTGTAASHSISPLPRTSSPNPFLLWFIFCLLLGTYAFFTTHDFSSLWFIDDLWCYNRRFQAEGSFLFFIFIYLFTYLPFFDCWNVTLPQTEPDIQVEFSQCH